MKRLSDTTISAVKSVQDIVGIIQDYVKLQRRGRNYIGLCPFHSEKSPSFTVSPDKRLWHCFGCKESGDAIGFVMKIDHLSFTESIEHIAKRMGLPVEWEDQSPEAALIDQEMAQLRLILSTARDYFRNNYPASTAERYIDSRHVAHDIAAHFSIGYSPTTTGLITHLRQNGFSDTEIQTAGIVVQTQNGLHDRFSGRVIFPILDDRGRTIGFGGRVLSDTVHGPKYINSDETRAFAKRRVLFGLDHAKTSIRKLQTAIIMEGYLDVIMAHQYGFSNSVAALGTSFSADHARVLSRLATQVITAMDQDDAGQLASDRIYDHCSALGITVRVASFLEKDPAETLVNLGRDYFEECLENSISFTEFKFKQLVNQYPIDRIENVSKIIDQIIPYLRKETDLVVQRHYARRIASFLKIEPELVLAKISSIGYTPGPKRFYSQSLHKKNKYQQAEEHLLFSMATSLTDRERILETIQLIDFLTPEYNEIANLIVQYPLTDRDLIEALPDSDSRNTLSRLMIEHASDVPESVDECLSTIKRHPLEQRVMEIKRQLKTIDPTDDLTTESLLTELQGIIKELEDG